jgi:hypothetical protein
MCVEWKMAAFKVLGYHISLKIIFKHYVVLLFLLCSIGGFFSSSLRKCVLRKVFDNHFFCSFLFNEIDWKWRLKSRKWSKLWLCRFFENEMMKKKIMTLFSWDNVNQEMKSVIFLWDWIYRFCDFGFSNNCAEIYFEFFLTRVGIKN